jgi:PHP family Zn ribbon phosphoesterase
MSPRKIVAEAVRKGIGLLAITDHNSAANVTAVMQAAIGSPVEVVAGMEVCSEEEVHVLALFDSQEKALDLQSLVYGHLAGRNDPDTFGLQVIANEQDEVISLEERLLTGAASLSVGRIVEEIHARDGIVIASHVDRESYSVISQLGFIPAGLEFDALELTRHCSTTEARSRFSSCRGAVLVRNSDAHALAAVGTNVTEYLMECASHHELRKALNGEDGRKVLTEV